MDFLSSLVFVSLASSGVGNWGRQLKAGKPILWMDVIRAGYQHSGPRALQQWQDVFNLLSMLSRPKDKSKKIDLFSEIRSRIINE